MKQNARKLRMVGSKSSYRYDDPERISDRMLLIISALGLAAGLGAAVLLFSGCSSAPVTKVTYTLGGGLFVPASITVEQTPKEKK